MKRIAACLIALLMLCGAAIAEEWANAVVDGQNADRVHLRAERSMGGASMGLYFTGAPLTIQGDAGSGWTRVTIGTQTGYMMTKFLTTQPIQPQTPSGTVTTKTKGAHVNLRAEPSTGAVIHMELVDGEKLTVYGETASGWYYVDAEGTTGYIKSDYVTLGEVKSAAPVLKESLAQGDTLFELYDAGEAVPGRQRYLVRIVRADGGAQVFSMMGDEARNRTLMHLTDVNMDGHADLSVIRAMGASDGFARHFLYNPQTGLYEDRKELSSLSWYRCAFYPQAHAVLNFRHVSAMTGIWELYTWENGLMTLRKTAWIEEDDDGTMRAQVFLMDNWTQVEVYADTWDGRQDEDNALWTQQHERILECLWDGMNPGGGVGFPS